MDINKMIAERLKAYRNLKGLTQEELGFLTNIHRTYIGRIERCEKHASVETIYKICKGLDVSMKDFFDFDKEITSHPSKNKPVHESYEIDD